MKCVIVFRKLRRLKCQYCGKKVVLPFRCPFCHQYFCVEHRLPENHDCPEIWRARAPRQEEVFPVIIRREPEIDVTPYEYRPRPRPRPLVKAFWFSSIELKHLAISAFLVLGVGLSILLYSPSLRRIAEAAPEVLLLLVIAFTSTFLLHELAHKLVAQRYGLWAEFRLTPIGALITLLSIVSPFKIISPGAVVISGVMDREVTGRTAIAGPLTNILLSSISLAMFYLPLSVFRIVAMISAAFNAWIALFNLIPFGMLDGAKVFWWSKVNWGITFAASLALTVLTYTYIF